MDAWTIALYAAGLSLAAFVAIFRRIVVREGFAVVVYRNGRYVETLTAGRYFRPRYSTRCDVVDLRQRTLTVPGQELLTADNVSLKLSAVATFAVIDADAAVNTVQDYAEALYAELQLAVRSALAAVKADDIVAARADIGARAAALAAPAVERFGLRLARLDIKDIMFPSEFKRAFAEVVRARQEGLAAIERARAESAVLRNLANTARLLESNPALMNLRILQSASATSGNTLVLGVPQGLTPMSKGRAANGSGNQREQA